MLTRLAAELRDRARKADPGEQADLLFLAAEYEAIAACSGHADGMDLAVLIPK